MQSKCVAERCALSDAEHWLLGGYDVCANVGQRQAELLAVGELAWAPVYDTEIADHLVLSPRTVETHIYRAIRKLGVNDRREFQPQI